MNHTLPTSLTVGGVEYNIESDFRAALDIFAALNDPELDDRDKSLTVLIILYKQIEDMPPEDYQEALEAALVFLNGGAEERPQKQKSPVLVSWEQDFNYIVSPINHIIGQDVRGLQYLHWWTFLSAYYEIGDCTFAQIVRIRDQKARGKKLDKADAEWYRKNRDLVDIKMTYTKKEKEAFAEWGV